MMAVRARLYGSGKFHIAEGRHSPTLCGRTPEPFWVLGGNLADLREAVPHRICKRCMKREQ